MADQQTLWQQQIENTNRLWKRDHLAVHYIMLLLQVKYNSIKKEYEAWSTIEQLKSKPYLLPMIGFTNMHGDCRMISILYPILLYND